MRRSRALPALVLAAALTLTGCGSSGTTSASSSPSGTTASASPTPTPTMTASPAPRRTPDLPTRRVEAADMHVAVLGRNAARTPAERAVVKAWLAYWQGAADTYYSWKPVKAFTSVARDSAYRSVVDRMQAARAEKHRIVGWAKDNVLGVEVSGAGATIRDCTQNFTFTVDDEAEPVTKPDPFYLVTGTLKRSQGHWVVVSQHSDARRASCLS